MSILLPKRVRDINLYDPKRTKVEFDLSDNTTQWPLAVEVLSVLGKASEINLSNYPDIYASKLKEKLSDFYSNSSVPSLSTNNFVIGCGLDDVLDCITRALTEENELISVPTPSFPMVKYFASFNSRNTKSFKLNNDGSIDISKIDVNSKLIYLCSPNNPTGLPIPKEDIKKLLSVTEAFVVIDEAYADFAQDNCLDLLSNSRVIITRTFSKMYGLAGLRVGYAIGSSDVITAIEALRGPYKVNTLGMGAAITSLNSNEYYLSLLNEIKETREWLYEQLLAMELAPIRSSANFIYVQGSFSKDLNEKLRAKGYGIRQFFLTDEYEIEGIRITLAPKEILKNFLEVLKENL